MNLDYHSSDHFITYYKLGSKAYRDKVKYFEDNRREIETLSADFKVQIKIDYVLCLYEIGRYEFYLKYVDELIEYVIIDNIYTYNNHDIYPLLLYRKAASLYHCQQYEEASRVSRAVLHMDAKDESYRFLYKKCNLKLQAKSHLMWKGIAVLTLLLAGMVSFAHYAIVEPFYYQYAEYTAYARNGLILCGISAFILREFLKYRNSRGVLIYNNPITSLIKKWNKWFYDQTTNRSDDYPF